MADISCVAFIGGGNMASAIIGGLRAQGMEPSQLCVVEPWDEARARLLAQFGVQAQAQADERLQRAELVVWAVKPQVFAQAAQATAPFVAQALHLSVAAGIPTDSMARWLGSERIVRCMPNTPALIGQGMTALYARPGVTAQQRALADAVLASTGATLWLDAEAQLDAVTALSGSGPAYFFYFLEAMTEAGRQMGLSAQQAHTLAVNTCVGAGTLARQSQEPPAVLRERVTSKGGTTYAALSAMEAAGLKTHFIEAMHAAYRRAQELGREFGG
ncbi:MAG: pyrroline-5-carboxylate reductase [Rhodoferax sp.]